MIMRYGRQWLEFSAESDALCDSLHHRVRNLLSLGHNVMCLVPNLTVARMFISKLSSTPADAKLVVAGNSVVHPKSGAKLKCRVYPEKNTDSLFYGLDTTEWVLVDVFIVENQGRKPEEMTTTNTNESKPLDSVIAQSIAQAAGSSRGFVLDLMHTLGEDTRGDLRDLQEAARAQIQAMDKIAEIQGKDEDLDDDDKEELGNLSESIAESGRQIAYLLDAIDVDSGHKAIEVRESLAPVDDRVPPSPFRQHTAYTLQSLAEIMLTMGNDQIGANQGVAAFIGKNGITAELNGWQKDGDIETVFMPLGLSQIFMNMESVQTTPGNTSRIWGQKDFVQLLMQNKRYINDDLAWIDDVRNLTSTTKIDTEAGVQRAENKQQLSIQTNAGAGLLKIPDKITFHIPILEIDDASEDNGQWETIEVMIDVVLPKPQEGRTAFGFELIPIGLSAAQRKRTDDLLTQLQKAIADARVQLAVLDAWEEDQYTRVLVVCGEPGREQRALGCEAFGERA